MTFSANKGAKEVVVFLSKFVILALIRKFEGYSLDQCCVFQPANACVRMLENGKKTLESIKSILFSSCVQEAHLIIPLQAKRIRRKIFN